MAQRTLESGGPTTRPAERPARAVPIAWTAFVVIALLALDLVTGVAYAILVTAGAAVVAIATRPTVRDRGILDRRDLAWAAGIYVVVVGLFRLAFEVFTPDRTLGMFLSFATGLIVGTVVPIVYMVWLRRRPLTELGLGIDGVGVTVGLALLFAGVQFVITLAGVTLPEPIDWVPLLVMSLTVGAFESIFFRGFLQGRLVASVGPVQGVVAAAALYAAYHVGYGMGFDEIVFLFGLGIVYAVAYAVGRSLLVLWPLLTPLGSFFAQLESGDLAGQLPWASIIGFADVLAAISVAIWLAARHGHRASPVGTAR